MPDSLIEYIIPENIKGKATSVDHSIGFSIVDEAKAAFAIACSRLCNVNSWHKLSGCASAKFFLIDGNGDRVEREVQPGDYLEIDIPGPGPSSGDGYDWVKVEAIESKTDMGLEQESFGMRLRPCSNPNKASNDTAHFLTSDATSTFIIHRQQNTVTSFYYGRNEIINAVTDKIVDRIRNVFTGAGALAGISELQWSRLIKSFLEKEN